MGRVTHYSPSCRVCALDEPGLYRTAAPVPPPYPNPEFHGRESWLGTAWGDDAHKDPGRSEGGQHGHHWYHGTKFSPDEEDEGDHPDSRASGGRLSAPVGEGGVDHSGRDRSRKHWNTDLGVHFSSIHSVAKESFTDRDMKDHDSRIAHASLHMKNPKHFDDETEFAKDAISWARGNGHHYLPQTPEAHAAYKTSDYTRLRKLDPKGRSYGAAQDHAYDSLDPTETRDDIVHIDKHGPHEGHGLRTVEGWIQSHPSRHQLVQGYRKHLQDSGHDGVVYGNDYEGPPGHKSAVVFPSTPITIHKWEHLHPEAQGTPATPQEARQRRLDAREPGEGQMKLFGHLVTAKEAEKLSYEQEEQETGGSKRPTKVTLHGVHPEHGRIGWLSYHVPRRKADKILVDRLEVHPEHQGNGYASALMDEMQRRHPKTPIDHGDRTDDGKAWWARYTDGKPVSKGRTIASRRTAAEEPRTHWDFVHHDLGDGNHRILAQEPNHPDYPELGQGRHHRIDYKIVHGNVLKPTGYNSRAENNPGIRAALHSFMHETHPKHEEYDPQHHDPRPAEVPKTKTPPKYYHGTVHENLTHVHPATKHGGPVSFASDTDKDYAYASTSHDDAWNYAQKVWAGDDHGRRPRVYEVKPIGGHKHVEVDPQFDDHGRSRGNYAQDFRSKRGWKVVREMPMPDHMGDPEEWDR